MVNAERARLRGNEDGGLIAVVTGASTGIGKSLSVALADEGYHVVGASRSASRLAAVKGEIESLGGRFTGVECDVADRNQLVELGRQVERLEGELELVCLNAGVTTAGPLAEHAPEDWEWVYGVVLMGVVHGIQVFLPAMRAKGYGRFLITGSQVGVVPDAFRGHGPYTSAKAAVNALALNLEAEVSADGIQVSLLVPANTYTELATSSGESPSARGAGGSVDAMTLILPRDGIPAPVPGTPEWLSADEVARIAVRGLKEGKKIIVTHPGYGPSVEEYFQRWLENYTTVGPSVSHRP
jgi:NAD(P)-dependent dehydrogenase (short-subunit alcohol dehydrogenase family)